MKYVLEFHLVVLIGPDLDDQARYLIDTALIEAQSKEGAEKLGERMTSAELLGSLIVSYPRDFSVRVVNMVLQVTDPEWDEVRAYTYDPERLKQPNRVGRKAMMTYKFSQCIDMDVLCLKLVDRICNAQDALADHGKPGNDEDWFQTYAQETKVLLNVLLEQVHNLAGISMQKLSEPVQLLLGHGREVLNRILAATNTRTSDA